MDTLKSEHRLGESVTIGGVTIVPIERVNYSADKMGRCFWLSGAKEPVAVIIITQGGVKAIDMQARERSLPDIKKMVPKLIDSLNRRLAKFSHDDVNII